MLNFIILILIMNQFRPHIFRKQTTGNQSITIHILAMLKKFFYITLKILHFMLDLFH